MPMVTNVYQYALILAVVRCREKVNRRSKTPRCEMNLCISHGKKCFSHPGRSLAHGKKINVKPDLFFPAVMPKKRIKKKIKRTDV